VIVLRAAEHDVGPRSVGLGAPPSLAGVAARGIQVHPNDLVARCKRRHIPTPQCGLAGVGVVERGTLRLAIDGTVYLLRKGSIYCAGDCMHEFANPRWRTPCEDLAVDVAGYPEQLWHRLARADAGPKGVRRNSGGSATRRWIWPPVASPASVPPSPRAHGGGRAAGDSVYANA
jgi:hypothetical protein